MSGVIKWISIYYSSDLGSTRVTPHTSASKRLRTSALTGLWCHWCICRLWLLQIFPLLNMQFTTQHCCKHWRIPYTVYDGGLECRGVIYYSLICETGFHRLDSFSSRESIKAGNNITSRIRRTNSKNNLQWADVTKNRDPATSRHKNTVEDADNIGTASIKFCWIM